MGAFENPIPTFELWPSFESDLETVNSDDKEERNKDSRQDDGPIDIDEIEKDPQILSQGSETTLRVANVNDSDYCQLDDLSLARNLTDRTMSPTRLSFSQSIEAPPIAQKKPKAIAGDRKKKTNKIFPSLFSRKKHQKKNFTNSVIVTPVEKKDTRDSPPQSFPHLSGLIINCDIEQIDGGWKQRNIGYLNGQTSTKQERPIIKQKSNVVIISRDLPMDRALDDVIRQYSFREEGVKPLKLPEKYLVPVLPSIVSIALSEKWDTLFDILLTNPKLLKLKGVKGQTLLHILTKSSAPEEDIVKVLNFCPEAAAEFDDDACLALHFAAGMRNRTLLVNKLVQLWPGGTAKANVEGDLPLHIASWAGIEAEENVEILLRAFCAAVERRNKSGELPLHLASSRSNSSARTVRRLLSFYKKRGYMLELKGNTPLHLALNANASSEVIQAFYEFSTPLFSQRDAKNRLPLHIALSSDNPNPSVLRIIFKGAPSTLNEPFPDATMPTQFAVERKLPGIVVLQLVLADMPISMKGHVEKGPLEVSYRKHEHSWWHLTTNKDNMYTNIIHEILSQLKLIPHIIALAQTIGPLQTIVYDDAPLQIKNIFQKNLILWRKYAINPTKPVVFDNGKYIFRATDREQDLQSSDPFHWLESGTAEIVPHENDEVEVLFNNWRGTDEFNLHCFPSNTISEISIAHDINIRKKYKLSSTHIEDILTRGKVDGRTVGFVGYDTVNLVVYELCEHTLADVFFRTKYRRRKNSNWTRKSSLLLKQVAHDLKHLHDQGLVHGYVEPATIGKFRGTWKLKNISSSTQKGLPMTGPLRIGIPPESVISSGDEDDFMDVLTLSKSVTFNINDSEDEVEVSGKSLRQKPAYQSTSSTEPILRMSKSYDSYVTKDEINRCEFVPERCKADPSWDIWSFGLVMGQLCLHQSRVLLPNFEEAHDAHLKNINQFDESNLTKIKFTAQQVAGVVATDLLGMLLHPDPNKRPKSMDQVLKHDYFHQHQVYHI